MSRLADHLATDWGALTVNDWIGLVATVITFLLMVLLYLYVLKPSNRERLEAHRTIVLEEDSSDKEDNNE